MIEAIQYSMKKNHSHCLYNNPTISSLENSGLNFAQLKQVSVWHCEQREWFIKNRKKNLERRNNLTATVNESRLGWLQSYLERKVSFQFFLLFLSFMWPICASESGLRPQDSHDDSLIHVTLCLPDFRVSVTWACALPVPLLDASLSSLALALPSLVAPTSTST